jgi:asparagine synthase (glutamine-hydrolysing)
LSGGLDSSTVVGLFQKLSPQPVDVFSIGFAADGYDEMEYARITARHFKSTLHEYYVTPADVLAAIPLVAQAYDEPFGNASAVPAYYCAKFAREHGMTQLLAGDGGDEIFAGNARYAKQKIFDLYRHVPGFAKAFLASRLSTTTSPTWAQKASTACVRILSSCHAMRAVFAISYANMRRLGSGIDKTMF